MANPDLLCELRRLETLRDGQANGPGQRQFRRHVVRGEARLFPADGRAIDCRPIDVQLRDVARGGLGLLCQQPLAAGSVWRIEFLQHGHAIAEQTVSIRHCREIGGGIYLCGSQFIASAGLLTLLGVPRADIVTDGPEDEGDAFCAPAEVA